MNELALFAGAGGGILGGHLLGWRTVCAVEWEPYAASVLAARQNDGVLPPFPIWDDVQSFDGRSWRGIVDVVSGGFPCQDISVAGKGAGIDGARSGMWGHMARIVGEVRPRYVFVENSPALLTRGLGRVLGDLAALGYDCRWTVLGAADVGAPHQRDRFWLVAHATMSDDASCKSPRVARAWDEFGRGSRFAYVAHADSQSSQIRGNDLADAQSSGCGRSRSCRGGSDDLGVTDATANGKVAHADSLRELQPQGSERQKRGRLGDGSDEVAYAALSGLERHRFSASKPGDKSSISYAGAGDSDDNSWWQSEPDVGRVANGVAARVDRLKAIGNGQVPLCAATAWQLLTETA
jgi:DNA (cytosine-5)-methyltransferase 1